MKPELDFRTYLLIKDLNSVLGTLLKVAFQVDDVAWATAVGRALATRPCDMASYMIEKSDKWIEEYRKEFRD